MKKRLSATAIFAAGVLVGLVFAALLLVARSMRQSPADQTGFWTFVGSMGAVVGVVVSVITLVISVNRSRFSMGVDILLRLGQVFDGPQIAEARSGAARALKCSEGIDDPNVDRVLDFFEHVGLLVRRGAIDVELVWHEFHYWIFHYHFLTRKYREREWGTHPSVWRDLDELYTKLMVLEVTEEPGAPATPTPSEAKAFLAAEAALVPYQSRRSRKKRPGAQPISGR